jgi:hypothetical protein
MRGALRHAVPLLLLIVVLLVAGCAGAPPALVPLATSPSFPSRDGVLRYRIPPGWFDATSDSQATTRSVFVVCGDYGGSISVKEMHVDAAARRDLARTGLVQMARLAAALETGEGAGIVAREPQSLRVKGREGATYDLEYGSGERVRIVLVDTGTRIYGVSALVSGTTTQRAAEEIFTMQQAFIQALTW